MQHAESDNRPAGQQSKKHNRLAAAHRIGQQKVVSVYRLIVKDSIEEKILHMQEAKKNLADAVLSGETGGLAGLSREELLDLIG